MKSSDLQKRLHKDRPMSSITLRMPEDVMDGLKRIAPVLGFSGYQPLIRAYIRQGLRQDLARLDRPDLSKLIEGLKKYGVKESLIAEVMAEVS